MSEKVRLTKEQAEAIEQYKNEQVKQLEEFKKQPSWFQPWAHPLKSLDVDVILGAIKNGYEVEPKYSVNDWIIVFHDNGKWKCTAKITSIDNEYLTVDVKNVHEEDLHLSFDGWDTIRHATPEEIAEEKERRWWKKHGREVWELRKGDILTAKDGDIFVVKEIEGKRITWKMYGNDSLEDVKDICKVVCFAEDRLDGDY